MFHRQSSFTTSYLLEFPLMESVRSTLQRIMAEALKKMPAEEAVLSAWPMVCGEAVARNTRALQFIDGTLTLEVTDKTWRAQLQDMKRQYCSAITKLSGHAVNEIHFVLAAGAQDRK
jgi:predicted nucleic acid-binding Zn ribbon protein